MKPALNYTGSKYKLLPQILLLFPKKYNNFIDLFGGGASVAVNIVQQDNPNICKINDIETKLIHFAEALHDKCIEFSNKDFREVSYFQNDFIYADPPYLISNASYNENGGWSKEDELELYSYLDAAHKKGAKFALSNVLSHKGTENMLLKEWSRNYTVHFLDSDYNNSNYQSKARNNVTVEILVTNYSQELENEA
ncbi:MAG: DNA adenine methylase [Micrococcaceae bacterium]